MACDSCGNPMKNIIPIFVPNQGEDEKIVSIIDSATTTVDDLSDADAWRFRVNVTEYVALTVALTLVAKEAGVIKTMPILKGTVIDRVELSWLYNKAIQSQTLTNNGGLTPPTLIPADVSYIYTAQSIIANMSLTIQGNDGLGQSGSIASDTESITFGNLMYLGHAASKLNTSASGMEAFIEALSTSAIKTARNHTYFATGGVNQKHFVAYPKSWGLATFTKGIFTGGYVRLKNVAGTLVDDIGMGTELDIMVTNSKGFSEAYYVYESLYDNQNDPVNQFVIS